MTQEPAQAPLLFFKSLNTQDYAQAWAQLSQRSQTVIVKMLSHSWKANTLEELEDFFAEGKAVAKTYWRHFAEKVQLSVWLEQSYQSLAPSESEAIVQAQPSNVQLLVYREGQSWKFGYIESFKDFQ